MAVRGVRGATRVSADERGLILEATSELLREILDRNSLVADDFISVVFTSTPDLTADFPAHAARLSGFTDVPLLCAAEIDVPGAMERVVRILALVETDLSRKEIRHVYLNGAEALRADLS